VVDRSDAENAVPTLDVPPGVPGHGGDAVAELDAILLQPLRDLQRAGADLGIVGGDDRPLDRSRHHRPLSMIDGGVVDDAMAQQRPILHQAEHGVSPLIYWT